MPRLKVVLTNSAVPLHVEAAQVFAGLDVDFVTVDASSEDELLRLAGDADAVIALAEPLSRRVVEGLPLCRSITRFGIGLDGVDIAAATEHGIWVTNVPDSNYREVAVHAITLALSVSRRIPRLNHAMHQNGAASLALAAGTRRPDDQTFGLLGMGRIGRRVAAMAAAIGYRVQAFDPAVSWADASALGVTLVSFDELMTTSDILSLHVPLLDSTRNIVSIGMFSGTEKREEEHFSGMKAGARPDIDHGREADHFTFTICRLLHAGRSFANRALVT
ncbi:phosphoglycerate dehydrogenase-like enzyme [Arthrobacter pascens]|uniref:NAD(P)-dependent oxidoreductase n=1 Tax=Arthrobacter pascens TaxID=1677 RepID=UPI00278380B4|nr:NAD(P)-dependent oxidoreductase [Arthrobacter pascens]MDQ0634341.1 phosphoglycerate dehydrogenase-like enzyme [Arthrobacter pascens]